MPKPDFADLDRQRLRLEENAERLRKGLKHWRVLDAEYEGMKEEILAGKTYPTIEDLVRMEKRMVNLGSRFLTIIQEAIGKEIGGSLSDGKGKPTPHLDRSRTTIDSHHKKPGTWSVGLPVFNGLQRR